MFQNITHHIQHYISHLILSGVYLILNNWFQQGTLAGNLMIKHNHREFISDVFTLFESIGATVKVGSSPTLWRQYTLLEFLQLDMYGKVIISIHLPTYSGTYSYRTFKIGKRYQNTIAYVNAAFLFHVDQQNFMVMGRPSIVMGGINPTFVNGF